MLVLGRGGAGKSTLARAVGSLTGLPVHELDAHFWQQGLAPLSPQVWQEAQRSLAGAPAWVLDGDLGPYDALEVRAARADTVLLLDYGLLVCAWRAARRSRERRDFWLWVLRYRRRHLPQVLRVLDAHAPTSTVLRLRSPRATRAFLRSLERGGSDAVPVRRPSARCGVPDAPDADERTALLHVLEANRRAAVLVVDGMSEADARRSVVPSGWTPFDLLVHLGGVERHWFLLALAGDTTDAPAHPGDVGTLAAAVHAYRAEWARSDRILADLELDDPLQVEVDQLVGEVTTVRGVLLHVIEETARHVGHLDLARELLDGRTGVGQR